MGFLRPLLCLLSIFVILLFPLLLVFLIIWWLHTHKEPESTLMGKAPTAAPTRASSAIEIPPDALATIPQDEPAAAPEVVMPAVVTPAIATPAAVTPTAVSEPEGISFAVTGEPPAVEIETPAAPVEAEAPVALVEVATPAVPVEAEVPAAPVEADDLKRLEGIGPKVAGLLQAAGILTFAQLAETDVARLREILDAAKLRFLDPATWPEQAALAAKGDWEAFEKLAGELKGGRRK